MILLGLGMGATFVSVTIAATSGVSPQESGLASGLVTTSQQVGGSIGLAILTGVATSSTTKYITNLHLKAHATAYQMTAATVHGYHNGYLIASTFGVAASILAFIVIKAPPKKAIDNPSEPAVLAH
jgi:MFS family permease